MHADLFNGHKSRAAQRGIGFTLSREDYDSLWSGRRGRYACMGRVMDAGPYALGNVYMTTTQANMAYAHLVRKANAGTLTDADLAKAYPGLVEKRT
jgi:hypothetical protein